MFITFLIETYIFRENIKNGNMVPDKCITTSCSSTCIKKDFFTPAIDLLVSIYNKSELEKKEAT